MEHKLKLVDIDEEEAEGRVAWKVVCDNCGDDHQFENCSQLVDFIAEEMQVPLIMFFWEKYPDLPNEGLHFLYKLEKEEDDSLLVEIKIIYLTTSILKEVKHFYTFKNNKLYVGF